MIFKGGGLNYKWKDFDSKDIPLEDKNILQSILHSRNISFKGGKDSLICDGSNNGGYSSKMGYRLLESHQSFSKSLLPLRLYWDKSFLPKVGLFS